MKQYELIYADPPWNYRDKCHSGQQGAGYKYNTMSLQEIMDLPVNRIAAKNCLLALWWVPPQPVEALTLVSTWGFTLKTMCGFTWHKITADGYSHFGRGSWTRANAENCLFAVKGKPKRASTAVSQMIVAKTRAHSQKPDEVRERLVQLVGDVSRIELFARTQFPGWDVWGNEVDSDVQMWGES